MHSQPATVRLEFLRSTGSDLPFVSYLVGEIRANSSPSSPQPHTGTVPSKQQRIGEPGCILPSQPQLGELTVNVVCETEPARLLRKAAAASLAGPLAQSPEYATTGPLMQSYEVGTAFQALTRSALSDSPERVTLREADCIISLPLPWFARHAAVAAQGNAATDPLIPLASVTEQPFHHPRSLQVRKVPTVSKSGGSTLSAQPDIAVFAQPVDAVRFEEAPPAVRRLDMFSALGLDLTASDQNELPGDVAQAAQEAHEDEAEEADDGDEDRCWPSQGSIRHPRGCSKLGCKYAQRGRCKDGLRCKRCHLCQWRRKMEKDAVAAGENLESG
eukprot:CAMPEP_0115752162 /NCGR_PEP_ID=MMETSP0272-20121206/95645_1 /TAXON_ID=71861 /ORGANISM="Scrippsiella trochoidea, Strain CCMP3099" /LENGTH=329 /DNA_ID=CAMNT_0003197395 /DNA_START=49 /DNA_END=1034 /DNA_ORIENTATION=-